MTRQSASSPTAPARDTHCYTAGIIGITGWLRSEQVAGFDRNQWLQSSEYAMREGRYVALLPSYTPVIEPSIMVAPLDLGIEVGLWLAYNEDQRRQARVKLVAAEIQRLAKAARGTWFL